MTRCSLCRQEGHNRRTCPQRNTNQNQNHTQTQNPTQHQTHEEVLRKRLIREKWKNGYKYIKYINRFIKIARLFGPMAEYESVMELYPSWLKIKEKMNILNGVFYNEILDTHNTGHPAYGVFTRYNHKCMLIYRERNPERPTEPIMKIRTIRLCNMNDTNYLIYWVIGNYLITDLDAEENRVKYIGLIHKKSTFDIKTMNGHRIYIVPYQLDLEPRYHPRTDKEFYIQPECQINIHEEIKEKIIIDEGISISEVNQWKSECIKLDFIIDQMIRLGAKENETMATILDLYDEIKLKPILEVEKEMAGVPSALTNLT